MSLVFLHRSDCFSVNHFFIGKLVSMRIQSGDRQTISCLLIRPRSFPDLRIDVNNALIHVGLIASEVQEGCKHTWSSPNTKEFGSIQNWRLLPGTGGRNEKRAQIPSEDVIRCLPMSPILKLLLSPVERSRYQHGRPNPLLLVGLAIPDTMNVRSPVTD
jgi:hypothetical protein